MSIDQDEWSGKERASIAVRDVPLVRARTNCTDQQEERGSRREHPTRAEERMAVATAPVATREKTPLTSQPAQIAVMAPLAGLEARTSKRVALAGSWSTSRP